MNNLINIFNLPLIFKIAFLIVDAMFIIFLLVVIRQAFAMTAVVQDINDSIIIKSGAVILFIFAISLFLAALVIL